ncbi:MAG TPA: sigma-70 family RNA polymerase sigma factor [Candidatus Limnocylindrales bacterium]|nr:sigma-70 family RNA polymerase sigma factor [Candidatus Limnocylindrales bacterium]
MAAFDRGADAELVQAVAGGSEDALGTLYDRYAEGIHAAAYRLTADRGVAEEVVQETFLALWNRAELFDPATGSLTAWLHAIARNRTVDRLRAAGRRPTFVSVATGADEEADLGALDRLAVGGSVVGGAQPGPAPEAAAQASEVRSLVSSALAAMPDVEREVIVLAYREGLTQSEIASRLGWPIGTVKTRTRRALSRLRQALEGPLRDADALPARPAGAALDADG